MLFRSQWAAPVARDLIAAYYGVDQYEGNPILAEEDIPDSVKEAREVIPDPEADPLIPVDPTDPVDETDNNAN